MAFDLEDLKAGDFEEGLRRWETLGFAFSAFLEGFFEGVLAVFDWWVVLVIGGSIWNQNWVWESESDEEEKWWKKRS